MIRLNLPQFPFRIKSKENKLYIFDPNRKKQVLLTEEEWVRQHFIEYLIQVKKYPRSLVAVEKQCKVEGLSKRTDVLVFDREGQIQIIVECKAPGVSIDQSVFDQIARYNRSLKAKFLVVTNGMEHFYCQMDHDEEAYRFLPELPDYA